MAVDESLVGRSWGPRGPYTVSAEKIGEFAAAAGATYAGGPAPATFPIVVAFEAMNALLVDPDVGIALHRVVHGEQRFEYTRPVRPGDQLSTTLTVASLRQIGGADIIGTRSDITDADGEPVCTAHATLVHRGEDA